MLLSPGDKLGPYEILASIGAGGMGEVYKARDTRLGRAVAIKISAEGFSKQFERESKVISSLNHPYICTLYDIGSLPSGASYMVTELVEGGTLRDWLKRSPAPGQVIEIARQVLEALRAAHAAGIIHRDLKPANIMIRFDGYAKVLDFGLARRIPVTQTEETATQTVPGQIMGTIAYMSPEQILHRNVDARSDLFAFGIILYELVAGRHPWPHESAVDVLHAIVHDDPPRLQSGWSGLLDRLLRKNPDDRYSSADSVLEEFARPGLPLTSDVPRITRLIVLPFRILRHDESWDFLSVSLPDAITNSLAAVDSLIVRSTLVASKFASTDFDLKEIGERAQVDAVLTGSMLSDGQQLRVTTQLVQVADGAVLWSDSSQVSLRNIFRLQDDLVDRIVQSLELPLTARERRALKHDVPASVAGYEFYLRANQVVASGYNAQSMMLARDLYLQAVDADRKYAPAWAQLGRAYRYLAKFGPVTAENLVLAEDAFQNAFKLNADLPLLHSIYTAHECDLGRSLQAMERLLKRMQTHRNDPNLFAGLVQACRYCGLIEASIAAHVKAKELDPLIRTSVAYSYLQLEDFQTAIDLCPAPTDFFVMAPALEALGRVDEAISLAKDFERTLHEPFRNAFTIYRAYFEGDYSVARDAVERAFPLTDPEARFYSGCLRARLDQPEIALKLISLAVDSGYRCHRALVHDSWLDSLRTDERFAALVSRAAELSVEAEAAFIGNGGGELLGLQFDRQQTGFGALRRQVQGNRVRDGD